MASDPRLSYQDYTVGWICALPVEAAAAKAMLDEKHCDLHQIEQDHNRYTLGRVGRHNVVITCLPAGVPGTNAATMVATQMRRTYMQIKFCLMVGVGGGVPGGPQDIRLGDVAVGHAVIQYDYGKTVQGGRFHQTTESNKPPGFLLTALGELQSKHMMEGSNLSRHLSMAFERYPMMATTFAYPGNGRDVLYNSGCDHTEDRTDCSQCEESQVTTREPRLSQDPVIHYGLIASGNQVMRDGATREKLRKQMGMICFEMEAAGLVNVLPCLVIRGICDYSDSHKNKAWQPYAAITAACYAKEFLEVQETCTVSENFNQPEPFQTISGIQSRVSSFRNEPASMRPEDLRRHLDLFQPENRSKSSFDTLYRSANQQLGGHTQTITASFSEAHGEDRVAIDSAAISETTEIQFAAKRDFREAIKQFESKLSYQQRTAFRSTTIRDVRSALLRVQKEQANRFSSMDLPRVTRFLEGIQMIEKKTQFAEKTEFVAYAFGTMKFSLEMTSNIPKAFESFVKAYKTIGEFITFGEEASAWLSVNPQRHQILARICASILQTLMLVLRALSIPAPILGQTFTSTWRAFSPQWEQFCQDLGWYKELVESQKDSLAISEYEQRRLLNLSNGEVENNSARRQWTEIKQWLAGTDSLQNHEDFSRVRYGTKGSGAWLLEHSTYVAWRRDDVPQTPILWLSGILGAGKTILASRVIDDCRLDKSVCTAFFYCHYAHEQRKSSTSILRSVIAQLLTIDHILLPWCYEQYVSSNQLSLMDEKMCKDILTSILLSNNKTFIVLDGLDECEPKDRVLLINFFSHAISVCESYDPGKLRVMFVSRDEHDIRRALRASSEITITTADNERDMKVFVEEWCQRIREKFELEEAEIDYISQSTLHRADVMINLHEQVSLDALQQQILPEKFPDGLDEAYNRILNRISSDSDSNKVAHAKKILGWMICARRPLKWHEIQGALSIDMTDSTIDFVRRRSRTHIREICGSLISNLSGDRLELVHISAKDYLTRSSFVEFSGAESGLTSLCLSYLSFDCFKRDISENQLKELLLQGSFAFQDYAVAHWSDHMNAVIKAGPSTLCQCETSEDCESALIDFIKCYEREIPENADIQRTQDPCLQFQEFECCADVCRIFQYIQQQRAKGYQAFDEIFPESLEHAIMANRAGLEKLSRLATLELDNKERLRQSYGQKWYKCSKAACYYFHEGFLDEKTRDYHVLRHEQPFRCPYTECESGYKLGFTTAKQREKHLSVHHPESSEIKAVFARVRKDRERKESNNFPREVAITSMQSARFFCSVCPKSYTRQEKLNNHLRKHLGENVQSVNFKCSTVGCSKSFSRDYERKRHEREVHLDGKRFKCTFQSKCGTRGPDIHGCGKEFQRLSQLRSHWNSDAGEACIRPFLEEKERERRWEEQIMKRIAEGPEFPRPQQLYDQFPDLDGSDSGESSPNASGTEGQSIVKSTHRKWQPFNPMLIPDSTESRAETGSPHGSRLEEIQE